MAKRKPGKRTALQTVERNKKVERVSELTLQGYTPSQIAVITGMRPNTVDVMYLESAKQWQKNTQISREARIGKVSAQLELGIRSAYNSFLASKENATETTTTYKPKQCATCLGTKENVETGGECGACGGKGKIMSEEVTTRVKGQAGDAVFLKEFRQHIETLAKIQGLYPEKDKSGVVRETNIGIKIDLSGASTDELLNAKVAFAKLKAIAVEDDDDPKVIEG